MIITLKQLGDRIKEKYLNYNDLDSIDLAKRVLKKYPQYLDMIKSVEDEMTIKQSDYDKIFNEIETVKKKAKFKIDDIFHSELKGVLPDQHHKEKHTIDSHDTKATGEQLDRLVSGNYADDLHIHRFPKWNSVSGATTFLGLTDTPDSFTGYAGQGVKVNATEDALEFYTIVDTDEKVGVDSAATPGYLGVTGSTGVLRVSDPITKTDGGDYITLGFDYANAYLTLDNRYLKLDCSNDPLTGSLETLSDINLFSTSSYAVSSSPFTYGGNEYKGHADVGGIGAHWYNPPNPNIIGAGEDFTNIDGITDIDVALYDLVSGTYYLTIYYMHGLKATLDALIDGFVGAGNWSAVYQESIFTASGGNYTFTGLPSGWTVCTGFTTPPICSTLNVYGTKLRSDGRVNVGTDLLVARDLDVTNSLYIKNGRLIVGTNSQITLSGSYSWVASGSGTNEYYLQSNGGNPYINSVTSVFINDVESVEGTVGSLADLEYDFGDNDGLGYSTLYIRNDNGDPDTSGDVVTAAFSSQTFPDMTDNMIQAFSSINNPVGNAAAFILGFQDSSSADVNGQLWALNMGVSAYGDCNYNSNFFPFQCSVRLDNNNHTANNLSMNSGRFTFSGGSHASSISNVGSLTFYDAITSRESGDAASAVTNLYLLRDSTDFQNVVGGQDFLVTNFYGVYIKDHSAKVSGQNWGIYNLSPTYLGGDTTIVGGKNIILSTTTGTKIGTATNQLLGFFNATPIVQPTGDVKTALGNLGLVGTPTYPTASDTVVGDIEIATIAETSAGTDATRAISPDGFSGSVYGKRIVQIKLIDDATALTTGDGKVYFVIPTELNGYNLVDAQAMVSTVSSSGTPTYQIYNLTQTADMLSVRITIDANENTSYTATTAVDIDEANDDVATGDVLRIDKDVAGTGEKGDTIVLVFQLP